LPIVFLPRKTGPPLAAILDVMTIKLAFATALLCWEVTAQTGPQSAMTNDRVIQLVQAGLHSDELERLISGAKEVNFTLTPAAMDSMLKAGVTEDTIKAMAARQQGEGIVSAESSKTKEAREPSPRLGDQSHELIEAPKEKNKPAITGENLSEGTDGPSSGVRHFPKASTTELRRAGRN
jgi:hypothetical protein